MNENKYRYEDFKILNELYRSNTGVVYIVKYKVEGKIMVMKVYFK